MKFGRMKGWSFEQQSLLCHDIPFDFGKFIRLAPENCDFVIYSNFCLFNNFLLKS